MNPRRMVPSKFKLTYFNIKGLGECVRFIFYYTGIDFEDNRIQKEDWIKSKDDFPSVTLPFLEVDGKILCQSIAICRYLGKLFNLAANDPWVEALLDAVVEEIKDLMTKQLQAIENESAELEEVEMEARHKLFTKLDKIVCNKYFYGKLTWVDLYFAGYIETITDYIPNYIDDYPNLKKLVNSVKNKPGIQKYIQNRPKNVSLLKK